MRHADVEQNSYLALRVKRYHTWPTINLQNVGEHSAQMMRIWFHIWGPMPPHISTAILWHDGGELISGDSPYTAKKRSPALKIAVDALAEQAVKEMGGPANVKLRGHDKIKVKLCDLIEMCEFGIVELAMGSNFGKPVVNVTAQHIRCLVSELDIGDVVKVGSYMRKVFDTAVKYGVEIDPWPTLTEVKESAA